MSILKDGQVTCCIIDGFEKDYYDLDELRQMAVEETSHFNGEYKQNGGSASVLEVARLDEAQNMVRVTYRFSGGDVYTAFFSEKMYYETVGEALGPRRRSATGAYRTPPRCSLRTTLPASPG